MEWRGWLCISPHEIGTISTGIPFQRSYRDNLIDITQARKEFGLRPRYSLSESRKRFYYAPQASKSSDL
jgi:nucleoside-diphosphate-sugar epimerase